MDNFLSNLPKIVEKKKKRVGRGLGSGRGAKSGRGTTRHQKARENIPLSFEGGQGRMIKKFPLLRGKGRNKSLKKKPIIIGVFRLNKFDDGEEVTIEKLIKKKIVNEKAKEVGVKILNNGQLKRRITITKIPVSSSVRKTVESLGGQIKP